MHSTCATRRRMALAIACSLATVTAGCAASPPPRPIPIASSEIAAALARPREDEAPLLVRDVRGQSVALGLDHPVVGSTPPDGKARWTTVRALAAGCVARDRASGRDPGACWLDRSFEVQPSATSPEPSRSGSGVSADAVATAAASVLIVGAIAGSAYCWYECKEPWDSAVPIAAGAVTLGTLIVGFALAASRMATVR